MATSTGASNQPRLLFGGHVKSAAKISKPETQAGIVMVSRSSTSARESLESVQREDEENTSRKRRPPSFENADRNLLQKGVLLPDQHEISYFTSNLPKQQSSNVVLRNNVQNGGTNHLNGQLQSRTLDPSLLPFAQREGPNSPDSGYSPDETNSTRRTPVSSGIPSSLWSGYESTLEFVAEGEEEDGEYNKDKETSSNSDEGSESYYPHKVSSHEPNTSIIGPLLNVSRPHDNDNCDTNSLQSSCDSSVSYFNPDDKTLVQVAKRKGIPRSASVEEQEYHKSEQYGNDITESFTNSRISKTETRRRRSYRRKRAYSVIKDSGGRHAFLAEGKDTFQIQDELGKDNYHFTLSEALIAVMEEYKSRLHEQAYVEYLTRRSFSSNSSDTLCSPTQVDWMDLPDFLMQQTGINSDGDDEERLTKQERTTDNMRNVPSSVRESTISLHQKWLEENYRADITRGLPLGDTVSVLHLVNSPASRNSAEGTANGLLQYVAKVLGGDAQVEFRAPQAIQLPSDFIALIQREELLRYSVSDASSPIRGGTDWAPPRRQVIHNVYPLPSDIKMAIIQQGGRCTGCGMILDASLPKTLRFCNYTGKYFCVGCHDNSASYIPGHIIKSWSFKRLPVSNFARDTLTDIEMVPWFNLESLNPSLYDKISELKKVKIYRTQLLKLREYISTCSRAEKLQSDYYDYYSSSNNGDIHMYSLNDFMFVKNGCLSKELKDFIAEGEKHVKSCLTCQGKGFVCEFCQNDQSIIFPFQLNTTSQCPKCHSCFHKSCYNYKSCPRCERLKERQQQRVKTVIHSNQNFKS